jgi:hypothetical protein
MVTEFGEVKKLTVYDSSKKAEIEFDPNPPGGTLKKLKLTDDSESGFAGMVSLCAMGVAFGTPGHPNVHITYDTSDNEVDKIELHRL